MSDALRAALIACMAELELAPEDEGRCGEYPELCTACKAYQQARAALASDAGSMGALDVGTTTDCAIEGVHEHTFRGPHRFREWDPDAYADAERQGES